MLVEKNFFFLKKRIYDVYFNLNTFKRTLLLNLNNRKNHHLMIYRFFIKKSINYDYLDENFFIEFLNLNIFSNINLFSYKIFNYNCILTINEIYLNNLIKLFKSTKYIFLINDFFLLSKSPWPIFTAISLFILFLNFTSYLNYQIINLNYLIIGLILIILSFFFWLRDIFRELTFLKRYSNLIKYNLRIGFWLFIVSEFLFFIGFFWAFFHASWEPSIQIATFWPPIESIEMSSLYIPSMNTIFLLLSGISLNWTQYSILAGKYYEVIFGFIFIFIYAIMFMISQWVEYVIAPHQVNDSIFGSSLYILTAFHGMHVFIGFLMLTVCMIRFLLGHFKPKNYLGLILSGWYWHFVDVIWIFVFISIYLWGTWVPENIIIFFVENFFIKY